MNLICRIRVLAAVVMGAVFVSACSTPVDKAGDQIGPLVLHGISPRGSAEIQPFLDQVAKLSNGSIDFEFEAGWHKSDPAADTQAIEAVRSGSVSFAVVPVRAFHGVGVNSFDALIAPMTVDSYPLQEAVLRDSIAAQMLAGVQKLGLAGVGILPGPIRKPVGITRELLTPNDFQGARIAISDGAVAERSIRQLGATPLASAFNGAAMKGFDGLEQQVSSIDGNHYDDVVRSVTDNVNLWPRPMAIVGTAAAVAALSNTQLGILTAAAQQAISSTTAEQATADNESVPKLCERGHLKFVDANPDQLAAMRDAFAPVTAWLAEDVQTRQFLQRIQQLGTGLAQGPETTDGCGDASRGASASTTTTTTPIPTRTPTPISAPVGVATPLDGVFRMTTSYREGLAFGMPSDMGNANWGTYTWTFSKGHYFETLVNGQTKGWASGVYTVKGNELTMTFTEGGGSGPGSEATWQPGDVGLWTWSLYHDRLTIKWIDPTLGPTQYPANYAVKPWTRIGDAPAVLPTRG